MLKFNQARFCCGSIAARQDRSGENILSYGYSEEADISRTN
ncbi:MAG: hypothetical protein ABSE95_11040 [Thermodesulfobacteriota bacterium]